MAIDDDDRDHLFETLRQQYDEDDARTLITLLGNNPDPDESYRADVEELRRDIAVIRGDIAVIRGDIADLRLDFAQLGASLRDVVIEQSRTYQQWMFGLLAVYTAMAGTLVAIGAIIIS